MPPNPEFDDLTRLGPPIYPNSDEAFARTLLMDDTYVGRNAILYSSPIDDPAAAHRAAVAAWRLCPELPAVIGAKMDVLQAYQM